MKKNIRTNYLLSALNDQHSWKVTVITGALVAAIILLYLFPLYFWQGQGGFFEKIDASQHIAGWQFYAQDEWRFPLLKTTRINNPDGVNIAFMDSIPLAALLFKPFVNWLPAQFHYIALWHILAFLGQGIAASVLVRSLGARSLFASAVAAVFACLWPALMWRFGHTALMTQCLVLFGLAVYFQKRRAGIKVDAAQRYLLLLSVLGLLIHPYFFAMLYAFFLFSLVEEVVLHRSWRQSIIYLFTSILIFAFIFYVLGYGGQHTTSFGFGEYSMNLSSPFCGSHFYSCAASDTAHQFAAYHFADPTRGQYEGLNYLGFGVLLLLPLSLITMRKWLLSLASEYRWFILFLLALTLYACANRIFWNEHLLFEYRVPVFLRKITDTFRSSGRFFWPVAYTLLFIALAGMLQTLTKVRVAIVLLACVVQFEDTRDFSQRLTQIASEPSQGDLIAWEPVMRIIDDVHVYPAFSCGANNEKMVWFFQRLAAHYRKRIDTGYIARDQVDCIKNRDYFSVDFVQNAMYVMALNDLLKAPAGFVRAVNQHACVQWQSYLVCVPNGQVPSMERQALGLAFQGTMDGLHWSGKELFTQVGEYQTIDREQLLVSNGKPGVLSYGPYAQLLEGNYEFVLDYQADSSDPSESTELANWEVWVNLPEGQERGKRLASGVLKGIKNQPMSLTVPFTISKEVANQTLEFRTFYQAQGKLTIRALHLKKQEVTNK